MAPRKKKVSSESKKTTKPVESAESTSANDTTKKTTKKATKKKTGKRGRPPKKKSPKR
jgi:hypothetical protein